MDLAINFENRNRLNIRVAAIIEHNNQFLVYRDDHANYDYFIGGRIQLNESSLQAIQREIFEELNETVDIQRLLFTTENFFYEPTLDLQYHEVGYYYLAHLDVNSRYLLNKVTPLPKNCEVKWVSLEDTVMPKELFEHIKEHGILSYSTHLLIKDKTNDIS